MARINFEDELESDFRFKRLARILGDEDKAFGMIYRFWKIAQKLWGDDMALMSEADFSLEGFKPILEAGLAEVHDKGVYAKGSEERFAWYLQKCRASKLGVAARTEKTTRLTGATSRSTETASAVNPLAPSPSLAPIQIQKGNVCETESSTPIEQTQCEKDWLDTLTHFGIPKSECSYQEKERIRYALKRFGLKEVRYALVGMRFEPKTESFNPANYVNIKRAFDPDLMGKFQNLAVKEKAKQDKLAASLKPAPEVVE